MFGRERHAQSKVREREREREKCRTVSFTNSLAFLLLLLLETCHHYVVVCRLFAFVGTALFGLVVLILATAPRESEEDDDPQV